MNFIQETEDEFISNLLESEEDEIKNFSDTLSFINEAENNNKDHYLSSFKKIKDDNYSKHSNAYIFILRQVSLSIIDKNWHNHIQELTNIRMSVSLSGYGGKDPLNEFRKASLSAFNHLIYEIQKQMVLVLNNIRVQKKNDNEKVEPNEPITKKIGRNDPCPCGSGKKYKVCHGS